MFRKCIITFAALATLGAAALAPGPASAHWGGRWAAVTTCGLSTTPASSCGSASRSGIHTCSGAISP
jgi:hypothetical protein